LGGIAEGTVGVVAERSTLVDYPLGLSTGAEHVAALSDALAMFGRTVRVGIEEMNELEDAGSADILTEISRGVDKWLWFVEAHQQGALAEPIAEDVPVARTPASRESRPARTEAPASRQAARHTATGNGHGKRQRGAHSR